MLLLLLPLLLLLLMALLCSLLSSRHQPLQQCALQVVQLHCRAGRLHDAHACARAATQPAGLHARCLELATRGVGGHWRHKGTAALASATQAACGRRPGRDPAAGVAAIQHAAFSKQGAKL